MRGQIVFRQKGQGKGCWYVKINTGKDPVTNKYHQHWEAVPGGRRAALTRLTEIQHQLDNGTYIRLGKTTVADYLQRWLSDYAKPNLSPRTVEGYEYILRNHVCPALGYITLSQLKPEHISKYYAEKQKGGLSSQSVRHHHTVLHKALKTAMEWGLINRNPSDAVSSPRARQPEMQVWNEREVHQFLEAAKGTQYYAAFYTALYTGMRRSELLALRWSDIDFILGEIHVNRSLHVLKGRQISYQPPKTKTGKRTISLPPSAFLVLESYRAAKEIEAAMLDTTVKDDDLVFNSLGNPLLPATVSHAWQKLIKRSGVKSIRLHDARHTHASLMLKQGIHPKVVQERLGHSSISITLDTYSHVTPGLQEAAAKRFDEAMQIGDNEITHEKVL